VLKRFLYLLLPLALLVDVQDGWTQQREVTGAVVTEATNAPLAGATVTFAGTTRGVRTDPQGNFRITVPAGDARLRVSMVGYRSRDIVVPAGQTTVRVTLQQDVLNLEGIVVTGQATTVARRNLANAVASVTAEELEVAPTAETIEKVLQGRVAGANIETNSGAPGGGVQVRLRGVSTIIGASEPLYVVDGVVISNVGIPSNANVITRAAGGSNASTQDAVVNRAVDINPADIESIEILKGASAAALYGSRASNGVILITTKRGRLGAPRLSLTQRLGVFTASNSLGFRQWNRDAAEATFGSQLAPGVRTADFFNPDGTPKQVFDNEAALASRNDLSTETVLSVSGGNEGTRYFASGTWKEDKGIIENTGFDKQGFRVNLEQRVGERLRLVANTNLLHTLARRGLTNNDNAGVSYYMVLPFTPNFFDLSRTGDGTFPANLFERSNPLQTAAMLENDEDVWRVIAGGTADFDVFRNEQHNLKLVGTGGADYFNQENRFFSPPNLQFEPDDGLPGTSLLSNSGSTNYSLTGNVIHVYTGATGFTATSTVGTQYGDRNINISRIVSQGLTAGQPNVDAGVVQQALQNRTIIRDLGFFGQEELLMLDGRLLLTAGLRADRSSVNGDPQQYFFYPKAAASYRFIEPLRNLDDLKLRVAFGQSGNQPLFGQKFTPLSSSNNIGGIPGLTVLGVFGSPDLQPERQTEVEGGFDATVLNGNARLEATVYQKNVSNLLLQRTPAPSTGFNTEIFNGGEMRVRGLELSLDATPIRTRGFSWVSRTTFASNRSEITSLPVPTFETGGFGTSLGSYRIQEGASATQIVANSGRDAEGNIIVAKVGDANPDFRMGFSNDLTFGAFSLSSLFDWSQGQSVINLTQFLADAGQNSVDFAEDVQPYTRRNGTVIQAGTGERRLRDRGDFADSRGYIEDGSYIKLRELSLSYTLPQSVFGRALGNAESARLTLSGRNLITITDYSGLDPEVSNFGNVPIARNIDVAPFPPSRSFWLSLDFSF
jgi:TonB-linked SusC/RagA family outer membrane protein